jgi:hypothetical protein
MSRSAASLFAVLALSTSALADDLFPPVWRFTPGSTDQHWDFSAGPAGGVPDALPLNNPYGAGPLLSPLAPAAWSPALMGRNDVWDISAGGGGGLDFFVPNTGVTIHQKNLWLQITYWAPIPGGPLGVSISSGSGAFTQLSSVITPLPGGWYHELSVWNVPSCPQKEVVHLFPMGTVAYVDQVVIDTQCIPVPAPTAAATLALAGLVTLRRRR